MPFFSLFKQEQEVSGRGLTTTTKPHVHAVCNPHSLYTVFYLIHHFYSECAINAIKLLQYILFCLFPLKSLNLNDFWPNSTYPMGPHLVSMDGPLCRPHTNFLTQSRQDSTVGRILSFRLQGSGFEPPTHHIGIGNSRPFHTVVSHHYLLFSLF